MCGIIHTLTQSEELNTMSKVLQPIVLIFHIRRRYSTFKVDIQNIET